MTATILLDEAGHDALDHTGLTGVGGSFPSGTSNPAQPAFGNNIPFFRTDLGLIIYYDGTRWLSTTLYHMLFGRSAALGATGLGVYGGAGIGGSHDLWLEDAHFSSFVQTTNNGTHNWTLDVYKSRVSGDSIIATRSTSADTVDVKKQATVAIDALAGTDLVWLYSFGTKVNSPGFLTFAVTITYRLVVT